MPNIKLIIENIFYKSTNLTELYDPVIPSNVKYSIVTKSGVQGSVKKISQYSFKTSQGNDVKVHFSLNNEKSSANVVFYVNNTLYDNSSGEYDPEILSSVLGIIRKVANQRKLSELTFTAFSGAGDTKNVKNIPFNTEKFLHTLSKTKHEIEKHEVKMLPPSSISIKIAQSYGVEPKSRPEFNKEELLSLLEKLSVTNFTIDSIHPIQELENLNLGKIISSWDNFLKELGQLKKHILSKTEQGLTVTKNRRESIYSRLIDRFFSSEWNVEKQYDHFTLTRKS
jgi:hypothetical protein